ncbi:ATP-binding cassette domain-containing protein [Curtobacterium sp. RRHDQ10]|uniref:ATP-binding cassette domain-containing protein n=1 Tax=Curtobacterium phyllosphaerae TaxID=3413379 RepID=UPI003BF2F01A
MSIIEAAGLTKTYASGSGPVHALAGLDLDVPEGTVTALLGPNGAGKTTTVKVLTTLVRPDSGRATIAGVDVLADPQATRRSIGVSGQYAAVDENLTGFENLEMIGRLYHLGRAASRARARELIDVFDLSEAGDRPVKGFSGGMRRRIDLAGALVMNPRVLFLDEPTTGLDPRSRLALWDVIEHLVADGATVLLTTQYLEEADRLADDVAVIDDGRVIARGTSDELKAQVGGHRVVVTVVDSASASAVVDALRRHGNGDVESSGDGRTHSIAVVDGPAALQRILADLDCAGVALHDAGMRRPTLDDVFLRLTGHAAAPDGGADDGGSAGGGAADGRIAGGGSADAAAGVRPPAAPGPARERETAR